jgi:site-specific recombinase XerD
MTQAHHSITHLDQFVAQKERQAIKQLIAELPDSLTAWIECYLDLVVVGARPDQVTRSIVLHLGRFADFFEARYGHERISTVLKRDVEAWIALLSDDLALAPATVNSHLASLSKFCSWVDARNRDLFACGNPTSGVRELPLPALEPQALSQDQVLLLKSVCDRLPRFHERKGRRNVARLRTTQGTPAVHRHARPYRDRAIVYLLLATGLRREELVNLNLDQVVLGTHPDALTKKPVTAEALRAARRVQLVQVRGKNRTLRNVFVSAEARAALADYLERERPGDAAEFPEAAALFLRAASVRLSKTASQEERKGRLATRSVNDIFTQIGQWYNTELLEDDPRRLVSFHPHLLRHTFGVSLAKATNADEFELQRRLGHLSRKYIKVYTVPAAEVAAGYIEEF